ncbi:MAG: proline hydroxylase, partial [Alphaproteobacteria bacterium]
MTDALPSSLTKRVTGRDWSAIAGDLDKHGAAIIDRLLNPDECVKLAKSYPDDAQFRSRIIMSRHGFGRGEYKYFA